MLEILKENSVYRMNDIVYMFGDRWQQDRQTILSTKEFEGTILRDYLESKRFELDFSCFKAVVKAHSAKYEQPHERALVVHLRLGDIMDPQSGHGFRGYEFCKNLYPNLNIELPSEIDQCTVVTALHYAANSNDGQHFYTEESETKSYEILDLVKSRFESMGLKVNVKSSRNVDEDICFMSQSRCFLKGNSGLSKLICSAMNAGASYYELQSLPRRNKIGLQHFISHHIGPALKYHVQRPFVRNESRYS